MQVLSRKSCVARVMARCHAVPLLAPKPVGAMSARAMLATKPAMRAGRPRGALVLAPATPAAPRLHSKKAKWCGSVRGGLQQRVRSPRPPPCAALRRPTDTSRSRPRRPTVCRDSSKEAGPDMDGAAAVVHAGSTCATDAPAGAAADHEPVEDNPELHPLKEALQRARLRLEEATGIRCPRALHAPPPSPSPAPNASTPTRTLDAHREALEAEAQKVAQLAVNAEGAVTKQRAQLEEAVAELQAAQAAKQLAQHELEELRQQMDTLQAQQPQGMAALALALVALALALTALAALAALALALAALAPMLPSRLCRRASNSCCNRLGGRACCGCNGGRVSGCKSGGCVVATQPAVAGRDDAHRGGAGEGALVVGSNATNFGHAGSCTLAACWCWAPVSLQAQGRDSQGLAVLQIERLQAKLAIAVNAAKQADNIAQAAMEAAEEAVRDEMETIAGKCSDSAC